MVVAGDHPRSARFSVVVYAGNSAESTWHVVQAGPDRARSPSPTQILLGLRGDNWRRTCVLSRD